MFRIKLMLVLLCGLLSVSLAHAAEVALVTEKAGSVQAALNGENWEVELAEILPDGVEIKVAADGSLVLIHLPTSREYRFAAEATATLTLAAVVGEKFSSGDVQLVSGNLALGQEMANQTGAVNPERVTQSEPPAPSDAAMDQPSSSFEAGRIGAPRPAMRSEKNAEIDLNKSGNINEMFDDSMGGSEESKKAEDAGDGINSGASVALPDRERKPVAETGANPPPPPAAPAATPAESQEKLFAGLTMALPAEAYAALCSDESTFKATGELVTGSRLNFVTDGWVEIEIDCGEMASTTVVLAGNLASITLAVVAPVPASITEAWKLEKNGHLQQAAAMWLRLLKTGVPEKKVAPHLKRLKSAIIGK